MLVSSGLESLAPQPRFDIDRGDVIVRTGTGPVGMCLNTLTSVLGGYCTLWLSVKVKVRVRVSFSEAPLPLFLAPNPW